MFDALQLMKQAVGESQQKKSGKKISEEQILKLGSTLLEQNTNLDEEEILITGLENTTRKVQLIKVAEAYRLFKELIVYYGITQLLSFIEKENIDSFDKLVKSMGKPIRSEWTNIGGQLIPKQAMDTLIGDIHSGKINNWEDVHAFYKEASEQYHTDKRQHAFASMLELLQLTPDTFSEKVFLQLLQQSLATKEWMVNGIYESREKDYANPFRQMVYETEKEMEKVIGKLKENTFIQQQQEEMSEYKKRVAVLIKNFNRQRKPASIKI